MNETGKRASSIINSILSPIVDIAGGILGSVAEGVPKLLNGAINSASSTVGGVRKGAGKLLSGVVESANVAKFNVTEGFQDTLNGVQEFRNARKPADPLDGIQDSTKAEIKVLQARLEKEIASINETTQDAVAKITAKFEGEAQRILDKGTPQNELEETKRPGKNKQNIKTQKTGKANTENW